MPSALARIQFRQGPAADWVASNPVLTSGEPGVELDTLKFKIGDGTRTWQQLPYAGGSATSAPVSSVNSKTGVVQLLPADLPGLDGFIRSVVAATLQAGSNIGITALSAQGRITLSSTGSASGITAEQVSGLAQFVSANAPVKSIVGSGSITVVGSNGNYTVSGGGLTSVDAAQVANLSQFVATNAPIKDIKAGSNVTVSSANGVYTVSATPTAAGGVTSLNGASGAVTLKAGSNATVTTVGGVVTVAAADAVSGINGQSGALTLSGADGLQVTSGATARDLVVGVSSGGTFGGAPVAPDAPTNVSAVAGDAEATVSWDAPSGAVAAVAYDVQYSASNGAVWQLYGQTASTAASVLGLANGQSYVFRVRAVAGVAGVFLLRP